MAHYVGPKNRLSRREGIDLFGKGNKLRRASQIPGVHGAKGAKRPTGYGLQLREKQKTKRIYGIMEKQFRKYFEKAAKQRGSTGERLMQLLEIRLDNTVYRLGLVPTRAMARQIVGHGHVQVNGKKVTIPSYQVALEDLITLDDKALAMPVVKGLLENKEAVIPSWLAKTGAAGKILSLPQRSEIDTPVSEQLIVEFYSR